MIRHILVPGLLGPMPALADERAVPRLMGLEALLARADREEGPDDYVSAAFSLFGLTVEPTQDPPTAALCYAFDAGDTSQQWLMHADPVHLRPDQDRLLLFDSHGLQINASESAQFVAAFNAHFASDGLELLAPAPGRWYLRLDAPPAVNTTALSEVSGRNIDQFLPVGERRRFWCQLLNEVQMLFHDLDANRQREARGLPAVSGIWPSGGGMMPPRGRTPISSVQGGDVLINALAARVDVVGEDELRVESGPWRALLDADPQAWADALLRFEEQLAPWMGAAGECRLYPCNGYAYRWRPAMRRRVWRRVQSFVRCLNQDRH